jgi:hypothetical protein
LLGHKAQDTYTTTVRIFVVMDIAVMVDHDRNGDDHGHDNVIVIWVVGRDDLGYSLLEFFYGILNGT